MIPGSCTIGVGSLGTMSLQGPAVGSVVCPNVLLSRLDQPLGLSRSIKFSLSRLLRPWTTPPIASPDQNCGSSNFCTSPSLLASPSQFLISIEIASIASSAVS